MDSASFEDIALNKHRNGLIGNHFEKPNISYTCPLGLIRTQQIQHKKEKQ